jgi:hypothetical protein
LQLLPVSFAKRPTIKVTRHAANIHASGHGSAYVKLKKSDHRHFRLPRARDKRPSRSGANKSPATSFDDLVGEARASRGDDQAARFGSVEVDKQLKLGRLLDRDDRQAQPGFYPWQHTEREGGR